MNKGIRTCLGVGVVLVNLLGGAAEAQDVDSPRDIASIAGSIGSPMAAALRIDAPGDLVIRAHRDSTTRSLCTGECEMLIPSGTYALSVGRRGDDPTVVAPVEFRGTTNLHVEVESRATTRAVGYGVMITGVVGSFLASIFSLAIEDASTARWTFGLGLAAGLTISSAGAFFAFQQDDVSVDAVTHRSLRRHD